VHVAAAAHAMELAAELRKSREGLVNARAEERRRLRRDLHDGLGPQLVSLALKLEAERNRAGRDEELRGTLAELAGRTRTVIADVRRLVYALRPPALDDLGLVAALREGARHYEDVGLTVEFNAPEPLPALPAAVEVAAYRIAQEALTNVVRHAEASCCLVTIAVDEAAGQLSLEIADNGRGLPARRRSGVGLESMRDRATELGGTWTIESGASGSARVRVELPLTEVA